MPQRSKKQKDLLPSACFKRIKGILFFNRHTPISNNKLKILLDERKDLSTALEDASTDRRLPQEFRAWLEKCHRELDKEVIVIFRFQWLLHVFYCEILKQYFREVF